jgi:hypothetical protein
MPVLSYQRRDISIHLGVDGEDALFTINFPAFKAEERFSRAAVDRAAAGEIEQLRLALKSSTIPRLLRGGVLDLSGEADRNVILDRVTLEVAVPEWVAIDWETLLRFRGSRLLRVSRIRPRVLQIPLSFPLRILETGGKPMLDAALDQTFYGAQREVAVINGTAVLEAAEIFVKSKNWATVDVLHLHELPLSECTLSTSRASEPGSAGWFLRFSELHQTRLFIIEAKPADLPQIRLLAQAIVDRGGPAVWLFRRSGKPWASLYGFIVHDRPLDWILAQPGMQGVLFAGAGREEALRYSKLASALSDPQIAQEIAKEITRGVITERGMPRQEEGGRRGSPEPAPPPRKLFVKAIGRAAKSLRIDYGATLDFDDIQEPLKAGRFGDMVSKELADAGILAGDLDLEFEKFHREGTSVPLDELAESMMASSTPLAEIDAIKTFNVLTGKLTRVKQMMPKLEFEDHESHGMLPVAAKVADLRSIITRLIQGRKPSPEKRHVNASFFSERYGELAKIGQRGARLRRGEVVHFGVQIGPKDRLTVTIGPMAFVEEMIRWEEETECAWLEIGVTAIDFDLLGAPVQEVGLPRTGKTDLVTFALRPRMSTAVPGVARLRFSIFYRNNVIQSFLVAALLDNAEGDLEGALAKALRLSPEEMKEAAGVGYLSRLEYSALQSIDEAAASRPRALTIVSNESAGQKVVTFKGDELFRVVVDANLTDKVREMREALNRASVMERQEVNPVAPDQPPVKVKDYRFAFDASKPNSGNPDELLDLMWDMARAGWSLYDMLVPAEADRQRVHKLLRQGQGIHAAHIDVSDVIPWSLIYDREVVDTKHEYTDPRDPNAPVYDVARAVCPASMPAVDGTIPLEECGTRKDCLLHPELNAQKKRDGEKIHRSETVICPRRFWGFMVPIEVPVQQVEKLKDPPPRSIPTIIKASKPAAFVAGFNPNLGRAASHEGELKKIVQQNARASLIKPAISGKEPLRQLLLLEQPDLVYFYCHAHASLTGQGGRTVGPNLDFGRGFDGNLDDVLVPPDLAGGAWSREPLVFMNGCGTVGFNPCAPSEFIKKFIQGRAASAVIGTEVTVWEDLAHEVAEVFFEAFLRGETAGDALLQVRRKLLAKFNPLGLVYTLYGSADLQLITKP